MTVDAGVTAGAQMVRRLTRPMDEATAGLYGVPAAIASSQVLVTWIGKTGSVDDVVTASAKYGDDVSLQAKESLKRMGKVGDDVSVDIALQGTKVPEVATSKVQAIIDKVGGVTTKGAGKEFDPAKIAQMSMFDGGAAGRVSMEQGRGLITALKNGMSQGKGIQSIIKESGLGGKPAKTLETLWKDPTQRKELLKLMADTSRDQPGMTGDVMNLIGLGVVGGVSTYDATSASTGREGF